MTAVESDYTDTFLDLLHHNSAGAALQLNGTALPVDSAANDLSAGPDRLTESGDFAQAHDPQTHAPTAGTSSSANAAAPPAAGPSGAGPSGASSSTRASPANLPSLPDTFPEPPVPVQAEDGSLPARSEFAAGLDAYVHSLHPIKRNKALSASPLRAFDLLRSTQSHLHPGLSLLQCRVSSTVSLSTFSANLRIRPSATRNFASGSVSASSS